MLDQARQAAGGVQQTVDGTVPEKQAVLLPKVLVDADVVLVLGLVIGSRVYGVIAAVVQLWTRRRKYSLDKGYHSRVDEVRWDLISGKWIANELPRIRGIRAS